MRRKCSKAAAAAMLVALAAGCSGPSAKLGRGVSNVTEFARMGEIRRSVEQTALWDGADSAYTTGLIRGFNRSLARTLVGAFEIVTFPIPIPDYDPILRPGGPIMNDATVMPAYPDSYKPRMISDSATQPDTYIGFSGGDLAPMVPGSRFRIYDY